jgi:hypothetical protein
MKFPKILALGAVVGLTSTACLDLDVVQNPNAPDAERALATPGDVEALIGGGWGSWWGAVSGSGSTGPILMTMAYQHSATAANFGMVEFSGWPKVPVHHLNAQVYYGQFASSWTSHYRAVSAVVDGLKALESGAIELPDDQAARARAFGFYVLGLAHGSTAMMFDQGYIYDPSIATADVTLHPYAEVMTAALGYFDKAIAEASGKSFSVPNTWISRETSADLLVKLAYSMKARYRAAVARTPAERAAVDWAAVASDASKGVTEDWTVNVASGSGFSSGTRVNIHRYGPWGQLSYQVLGMADQSGGYQRWMARDVLSRHPNLADNQVDDPFLLITPDKRFPQGATIAAQQASDGTLFELPTASGGFGAQWNRPDRGTFRWSYYRYVAGNQWLSAATRSTHTEISIAEMNLLRADAAFRAGDKATAAQLINLTRTAAGLNATDAAGTNTSCVPKLVSGACGDLWEMLKWEVRLETIYTGHHMASWYFHGRGWGDLAEGSFLHLPVPGREAELLAIDAYTFGGSGNPGAAPVGTYGY